MTPRQPVLITAILWLFAIFYAVNGIAMLLFPASWFFRLVPGVPETGPFNGHLVADGGTFNIALAIGMAAAARDAHRNSIAIAIAAAAGVLHAILHLYSHSAGLLSDAHLTTEIFGIYVPTAVLCGLTLFLMSNPNRAESAPVPVA